MITIQIALKTASAFYALATFLALTSKANRYVVLAFIIPGICLNAVAFYLRYAQAWPMLPMHLSPVTLPLCLAVMVGILVIIKNRTEHSIVIQGCLVALTILAISVVMFPKDFYLPFLKSKSILSHAFVVFGVIGKACFMVSSAYGLSAILNMNRNAEVSEVTADMAGSLFWGALGYAVWTVSMFSGELWSYLGWGTPVVWDDAALLTTMATWFYYTCFLHLQLTKSWNIRCRAYYASAGALVVFVYNCIPDLGPYRSLF